MPPAHFEVRYRTVAGASPQRVVRERSAGLLQPFIDAARALVAEGAAALSTSCGFLALFQQELQAALPVPVWTSSLLKLPELKPPGIVTADAAALGADHLCAVGADPATPVASLPAGGHLQRVLLENRSTLDTFQAEADTVAAARALCAGTRTSTASCSNAPTCRPTRRRCGRPPAGRCTTSEAFCTSAGRR